MQSTCRQCFSMCTDLGATDAQDAKGNYCFGGLSNEDVLADLSNADLAAWFKVPVAMGGLIATSTGLNTLDTLSLGIPLHAVVGQTEAGKITSDQNKVMWGNDLTTVPTSPILMVSTDVGDGELSAGQLDSQ